MLNRSRSHSPGKSPKVRESTRRDIDKIKLNEDFSKVTESMDDPIMQQIKANIPSKNRKGRNPVDNRSAVAKHFDEMLLPEEWLELNPVYLCTPPSLDTDEFQEILKVMSHYFIHSLC